MMILGAKWLVTFNDWDLVKQLKWYALGGSVFDEESLSFKTGIYFHPCLCSQDMASMVGMHTYIPSLCP